MCCRQAEMDARSQASEGQKALASWLIRLAMARTCCPECRIITLDEPTTNLDEDNADGLAIGLAKIAQSKNKHLQDLQLVLITHDQRFVARVTDELQRQARYYRVRQDAGGGPSRIISQSKPTKYNL